MIAIKAVHIVALAIGLLVPPLLGLVLFSMNGLLAGFVVSIVIAVIVSTIHESNDNKDKQNQSAENENIN